MADERQDCGDNDHDAYAGLYEWVDGEWVPLFYAPCRGW